MEIPKPLIGKNKIVVYCHNLSDGRGDFGHMKIYLSQLKKILGEKYHIVPILSVNLRDCDDSMLKESNEDVNLRQLGILEEFKVFCEENQLKPETITCNNADIATSENISRESFKMVTSHVKESALCFNIAYGYLERIVPDSIKMNLINAKQLGNGKLNKVITHESFYDHSKKLNILPGGSMGLHSEWPEPYSFYGIRLDETLTDINQCVDRLHAFKSKEGKKLLEKMVGENCSKNMIENYFARHKLMPGYPQNPFGAQQFILTGIYKNMHNSQLQHNCDFFVPRGAVHIETFQKFLKKLDIKEKVTMVTPDGEEVIHNADSENVCEVRIFSNFFLDDQEIYDIFRIRNDMGMGSGDNSILQVLSSQELPHFHQKCNDPGRWLEDEFLYTVREVIKPKVTDQNLIQDLDELIKYLRLNVDSREGFIGENIQYLGGLGYDLMQQEFFNMLLKEQGDTNEVMLYNTYVNGIKKMAEYAAKPGTQRAWSYVHDILKKDYDYNNNLKAICAGALYLGHPKPEFGIDGKQLPKPDELKQKLSMGEPKSPKCRP